MNVLLDIDGAVVLNDVIDTKLLQLEKALAPMVVTLLGIVIFVKAVQLANAYRSMRVTPFGIVMFDKDLH